MEAAAEAEGGGGGGAGGEVEDDTAVEGRVVAGAVAEQAGYSEAPMATSKDRENKPQLPPAEMLRLEAEGERRTAALVAEARLQAGDRCPECGALGSLEEFNGKLRCVDCDLEVLEHSRLGGLGKKLSGQLDGGGRQLGVGEQRRPGPHRDRVLGHMEHPDIKGIVPKSGEERQIRVDEAEGLCLAFGVGGGAVDARGEVAIAEVGAHGEDVSARDGEASYALFDDDLGGSGDDPDGDALLEGPVEEGEHLAVVEVGAAALLDKCFRKGNHLVGAEAGEAPGHHHVGLALAEEALVVGLVEGVGLVVGVVLLGEAEGAGELAERGGGGGLEGAEAEGAGEDLLADVAGPEGAVGVGGEGGLGEGASAPQLIKGGLEAREELGAGEGGEHGGKVGPVLAGKGRGRGMSGAEVTLDRVGRRFEADRAVLRGVSLRVAPGELLVLVGPSGCGKSTTLRLIAGLDEPDEGRVLIDGKPMAGVAPQARDVAMVFQGYALYPHMTAREILEFPLKMRKVAHAERTEKVRQVAAMLGIEKLLERRPEQLSGGERQRVAMGRAMVRSPRIFLFDEPLANLDTALRGDIRLEIGALVRRLGATALYVTHDHTEAMTLADRIAVLDRGEVLQVASPREIYERPATRFVAGFIGAPRMNLFAGSVADGLLRCGPLALPLPSPPASLPAELDVGVRPEHVRVLSGEDPGPARASGELVAVEPLGAETHLTVRVADMLLRSRLGGFLSLRPGDRVTVDLSGAPLHLFARDSGARLG
jgi:multiple sugar transport system ATP-binding protein